MKRAAAIVLGLVLLLGLALWLGRRRSPEAAVALETQSTITRTSAPPPVQTALLGETILRGYADTNLPPENDLILMARLMENSLLLLKTAAHRPLSGNEDWADLLRGKNGAQERFLPDTHPAFNTKGQVVDRWQTPLFFHALGGGRYEIRSAGPDNQLFTDDDVHRNANGTFRRGADLNPASLDAPPAAR